jgi:cytochrome c556
MMVRSMLTAAAMIAGLTVVAAQQPNPVEARKALMKLNGQHGAAITKMVRGEDPYDAAKVNAAFDQWADTGQKLGDLFPDNSKTGETRALPKIWEDRAAFNTRLEQFRKDVAENRAKATANLDGLKAAMPAVGRNCNACHETFRRPQG